MNAPNWFIGLPVEAGAWFEAIPAPPEGVRLFAPDDLHITVAFLGSVGPRAAEQAFALAPRWPLGAVTVTLGEVVPMGQRRRPSAFSAVLREPEAVASAMAEVQSAMCEAAGRPPEQRAPRPHVTLARPRRRATNDQRKRGLAWACGLSLGEPRVTLDQLALFTRRDDRSQGLFERVAVHPLNG